jgi:two-component system, sensor histidine kinase LadS
MSIPKLNSWPYCYPITNMFKRAIKIVVFVLLQYQVMGQAFIDLNEQSIIKAGKMISWKVTYDNIPYRSEPYDSTDGFKRFGNTIQNFGITDKNVYAQITGILNYGDSIFLMMDNLRIDSITVLYTGGSEVYQQSRSTAFSSGSFTARTMVFKIPDPAGQPVLVFLKSENSLVVPILIGNERGLLKHIRKKHFTESILIGGNIIFMLMILIMFYWNRDLSYIYYFAYAFFTTLFCFFYLRGFAVYFDAGIINFFSSYGYSIGAATSLFALLFSREFIQPFKNHKALTALINLLMVFALSVVVIDIIGFRSISRIQLQYLGLLTPVVAISFAAYPAIKGNKASNILLAGWLIIGTILFIYSLATAGVLNFSWFSFATLPLLTTSIEIMIFGSALAIRYIDLEKEKKALNQLMVQTLLTQKNKLEEQVLERTDSLERSNQLLQESNEVKARMISIISHDLKMPIVNMNAILDLLTSNLLTVDQSRRKLNDVKHSIGAISNTMENLLLWTKQQQKIIDTKKEKISLTGVINNIQDLLKGALEIKNLQLEIFISNETVIADRFQLETILRNLITNAIQHSHPDSIIIIGQTFQYGSLSIFVQNEGSTFTRDRFNLVMNGNRALNNSLDQVSNGIGLQLCKEFLKNHSSRLELDENPLYTRLYFPLPAFDISDEKKEGVKNMENSGQ